MPRRFAPRNDSGGGAIAPHVLATADTWQISACHCEPVRTLVRQSASPQGNGASWLLFRQIRYAFRICPKYCFSVLCYRRRADCPVASLLAMTCNNLLPVRTMPGHWRYAAGKAPLHPHPRLFLLHVIANQWNMGKPHCGFPQPLRPVTHHCTSCKIFSPVQKLGVDKSLPMWYSNLAVRAK